MQNGNENSKICCIVKCSGNGLVMTKNMQSFTCFNAKNMIVKWYMLLKQFMCVQSL